MKHFIEKNMTVYNVLTKYPFLISLFKKYGLSKFDKKEVLKSLGTIIKLKTALSVVSIDETTFINLLNEAVQEQELASNNFILSDSPEKQRDLTLLALLPCGMKMPFTRVFNEFADTFNKTSPEKIKYLVEGNVNHELSYYPYIEKIESIEELPDIIISSDINSFYHKSFRENFLAKDFFTDILPVTLHDRFNAIGYNDPKKQFTMISANLLVLVGVTERIKGLSAPSSWKDILDNDYKNTVVMRGQDGFFCNGVLIPFYMLGGIEGIKQMGQSVVTGLHPSEMVNMIDSKKEDIPPFYIMPYFFAKKIKNKERIQVYPLEEGALVSPVQMLVKKSSIKKVQKITDFLTSEYFGQTFADAYFPSTHSCVNNDFKDINALFWPGWDFLYSRDIGALKKQIEEIFLKEFYKSGGYI